MAEIELVEVRLIGMSVPDFVAARQHNDELNREFGYLLAQADVSPGSVPHRLVTITRQLRERYADFTAATSAELEAAIAAGESTVDLAYQVPAEAADAAATLGDLLDEADEYCAAGELLTLATPDRALNLRRWFLSEFIRQTHGEPPIPYPFADWATA